MIDESKYDRRTTLNCPTCGGTEFDQDDTSDVIKCAGCGLKTTKDALIEANDENVNAHVAEIGDELVKDMTKSLKDAFKGNKFIKIK